MSHLTYAQAIVTGLVQGVTELFPISSLGHNVLIPALIGGQWAKDLSVSAPGSPYLAFIVGLHVATALAMILYFWRDWLRIIRGFFSSVRHRQIATPDQRLAWMIILATIPVGIVGAALQSVFTNVFAKADLTAIFLTVNGLILLYSERQRRVRVAGAAAADGPANAAGPAYAGDPGRGDGYAPGQGGYDQGQAGGYGSGQGGYAPGQDGYDQGQAGGYGSGQGGYAPGRDGYPGQGGYGPDQGDGHGSGQGAGRGQGGRHGQDGGYGTGQDGGYGTGQGGYDQGGYDQGGRGGYDGYSQGQQPRRGDQPWQQQPGQQQWQGPDPRYGSDPLSGRDERDESAPQGPRFTPAPANDQAQQQDQTQQYGQAQYGQQPRGGQEPWTSEPDPRFTRGGQDPRRAPGGPGPRTPEPWQPRAARQSGGAAPRRFHEQPESSEAVSADRRLAGMSYKRGILVGAAQILALLPGISRDGIVTVAGMAFGVRREDAVRFSFLLSAPVILAAGLLKVHELFGPEGKGIHGPVVVGSLLSFIGAYLAVRFLTRYFSDSKSLKPFGIYCIVAGVLSFVYLVVIK